MTTRTSKCVRRLRHAASLAAVGVIAACAMMLTAPAGNAIPESQIQRECADANGEYRQVVEAGADGVLRSYSKCCYVDIYGKKHCDNYVDGRYTNTTVNLEQPPTTSPPPPPGGVVGPPATAATAAPPAPPGQFDSAATLYMPPPPGPAASPSEATLAP